MQKVWCVVTTPSGNQHKMPLKKDKDGNWHFVVGSDWEEGGDLNVGSFVYSDAAGNEAQILASGTISACILTYSDNGDGTCTVTGALGRVADLVVPAEIEGLKVAGVAGCAFQGAGWVESLVLPEGLSWIGDYAFESSSLRSVLLPSTLSTLGYMAFAYSGLESVELPGSLQWVASSAFHGCWSLESVTLGEGVAEILDGAFAGCSSLVEVVFPSSMLRVGGDAFNDCASLASVELPEGLRGIGIRAFCGCPSLSSVSLPSTLSEVGEDAFADIAEGSVVSASSWAMFYKFDGNVSIIDPGRTRVVYNGPATIYGSSLTLEGQIGVNLYVAIPDELRNSDGAYAAIDLLGTRTQVPLALAKPAGQDYHGVPVYMFTSTLYAKNMADNLTFRMFDADGKVLPLANAANLSSVETAHTYSVQSYYNAAQQAGGQIAVLADAMVNYGAAAQQYFGYSLGDLAGDFNSLAVQSVTLDDLAPYKGSGFSGKVSGLESVGSSLTLNESTTVSHYFKLNGNRSIDEYEFTVNGVPVTPVKEGDNWVVRVQNIPAQNLEDFHTLVVTGKSGSATLSYSTLSYAYTALNLQPNEKLVTLCKALYVYNQAANAYFGS